MSAAVLLVTALRDNAVPNTESEPNKCARSKGNQLQFSSQGGGTAEGHRRNRFPNGYHCHGGEENMSEPVVAIAPITSEKENRKKTDPMGKYPNHSVNIDGGK